jgi:hypothetical protein
VVTVVTPDGQWAMSACRDGTVKMGELETAECWLPITCDGVVNCCPFPDAVELIAAGGANGNVHFLHSEEPKSKRKD